MYGSSHSQPWKVFFNSINIVLVVLVVVYKKLHQLGIVLDGLAE